MRWRPLQHFVHQNVLQAEIRDAEDKELQDLRHLRDELGSMSTVLKANQRRLEAALNPKQGTPTK